jgi:hypothetical protein
MNVSGLVASIFSRRRQLASSIALLVSAMGLACAQPAGTTESGWLITVYYTAVESFHDRDRLVDVRGCLELECTQGNEPLGTYPQTFVQAVKDEGTGRITSGPESGRYLNWASSEGYWLDDAPRDQAGRPLIPYRSAAADGVPDGTQVRIVDCGRSLDGSPPSERVCSALQDAQWEIRDAFTPGFGGPRHIDLYIGEENVRDFVRSEFFTSFEEATLELRRP